MKILMICDKMDIGGAETHILTLSIALKKLGHDVSIMSGGGIYEGALKDSGIHHIYAPLCSRNIKSLIRSYKMIKKNLWRYDIIHAHTRASAYLASMARGKYTYPALIVTAHLNFNPDGFGRLAKWGDKTLSVSEDISDYLKKYYKLSEHDIITTVNGIDTEEFCEKRCNKKRILHISRIDEGRARVAFMLCEIATALLSHHQGYYIEIIGSGNLLDELRLKCNDINCSLGREAIVLRGARNDIAKILSDGGIFVGVSRAAFEAMASKCATIIAGDEGYGGIICKENFSKLAKSNFCARGLETTTCDKLLADIERLITNHPLRVACEEYGERIVKEHYSKWQMAADAIKAYKSHPPKNALLLGYFGFGNLGDEESLSTACHELEIRGININGIIGSGEFNYNGINTISRTDTAKIRRALRNSDALILPGGNLLQNETSLHSLFYYSYIMKLAYKYKKRIYMLSSGIGKIHGAMARHLTKNALKRCYRVGMRSASDVREAIKYGRGSCVYMPDLCFNFTPVDKAAEGGYVLILASSDKYINTSAYYALEKIFGIPIIVSTLFKRQDEKTVLSKCNKNNIPYRSADSADDLRRLIAGSEYVISQRLHGAIFSLSCARVCYLDTHSEKNRNLIEDLNITACELGIPCPLIPIDEQLSIKKEVGINDSDFQKICNIKRSKTEEILDLWFR